MTELGQVGYSWDRDNFAFARPQVDLGVVIVGYLHDLTLLLVKTRVKSSSDGKFEGSALRIEISVSCVFPELA